MIGAGLRWTLHRICQIITYSYLFILSKKTGLQGGWARFARKKGLNEHTFTFDSHKSCSWCFKKNSQNLAVFKKIGPKKSLKDRFAGRVGSLRSQKRIG